METIVTIPSPIYESAEQLAKQIGISRSEFYALALDTYIEMIRRRDIVLALDEIYAHEPSAIDPTLVQMQAVSLPKESW